MPGLVAVGWRREHVGVYKLKAVNPSEADRVSTADDLDVRTERNHWIYRSGRARSETTRYP